MRLSMQNFEHEVLQLQIKKTIYFRYTIHQMHLFMLYAIQKLHFHQRGPLELIKTMLKYLHVLLGLSPVWNSYLKGSTQCSINAL